MPTGRIGDAAVTKATGRNWREWLRVLDAAGARTMNHRQIVAAVAQRGAGPWWQQMVTVTYERERGLREEHQTATGYSASVSRTIAAPVEAVYAAWSDARRRARWLGRARVTIRAARQPKSMRMTWSDGTNVDVTFTAKGAKSQVALQHAKLRSQSEVAEKKEFWSGRMAKLRELLER